MRKRNSLLMLVSVSVAFFGVLFYTYAATTISTSIETGGTLTVTGTSATTLGGALTVTGVSQFNGSLHATSTALFTEGATMYNTLVLRKNADAGTEAEGGIYYDSDDKLIKLWDGTSWVNVATSTGGNGLTVSGAKIQLTDLNSYLTIGTTTQRGFSMLTLEATSTAAIPLTLRGYNAQTANLLQIHNVAGAELFAIDARGNATTTMLSTTGSIWVNGFATTTGSNGNFSTQGTVGVASSSPYVALGVTGTTTSSAGIVIGSGGTPINQILTGTFNPNPNIGTFGTDPNHLATTTITSVTGITTADKVFVTPISMPSSLYLVSASSTAGGIQVTIGTATTTTITASQFSGWYWMAIKN